MNKSNLECLYESIENKRKERDEYIKNVTKLDNDIQFKILEYRIESVKRVLENIQRLLILSDEEIIKNLNDKVIHCLNKLNGNIDGIELELGD